MLQTRQLAAIMFTDIVGYTALMGNDEKKAFELLSKNRQIQKPIIEQYNGKWIKELGDGVMASFSTVSDAVAAAIKIQEACNIAKEFQLRIGIHQGEVVIEENDMFGDAVNIASRIQNIASPGSIYISEVVHHNVSNKNDIETEYVKTENLKNVKEPVKIFRVRMNGAAPVSIFTSLRLSKKKVTFFVFLGLALVAILGYYIYNNGLKTNSNPYTSATENSGKSIAVLPFANESNDKDQEYFSDGLSEELLNMLAKTPELKVIGRTSSFVFKGKNEDLRSIARQLGVAHLLEGSVRKEGNIIRVTARLINADDGSRIWGDSYDRDLKNIFKLQEEIAQNVVQQLKIKLLDDPSATISGNGNVEAYNLILKGNYFYDKLDKENVAKAVDFYKQALAIDSTNARAWGKLANAISRQAWQNYVDRRTGRELARIAALKAIELDKNLAIGYLELGDLKLYQDFDWKGAEEAYQKALGLEPQNPDILYSIGGGLYFAIGRWKESIDLMKKCIELDPLRPLSHLNLGNILSHAGRPNEAAAYFKKALELNPQFQRAHLYLGRNYLLAGKIDLGLKEMQEENLEVFRSLGMALAYYAAGEKKEADEALKYFAEKFRYEWNYLAAELYAYRGENDQAFIWLENAYKNRDGWLVFLKGDPLLKNLQSDNRYKVFFKKMNLAIE